MTYRLFNQADLDSSLVLGKRTKTVVRRIAQFLEATDHFAKTIGSGEDGDRAERGREARIVGNGGEVLKDHSYARRITDDDNVMRMSSPL